MAPRSDAGQREVRRRILRWYARKGRVLPWRGIRDPYRILVAEIMSHQTRLDRVEKLYPRFVRKFPTFRSLAHARQSDVVVAWRGLGYNGRAVRLHRLAQQVVEEHGGSLPERLDEVLALPGIGPYTAHALMVALHGTDDPVVDVNVRRVLSRAFWPMATHAGLRPEREIWRLGARLVPRGRGYDWAQALMDLGAMVCTARGPKCGVCPVEDLCASRLILRQAADAHPPPRPERSMRRIPDRIYRGRVVEELRNRRSGIALRILGPRILPGFSRSHAAWFARVLQGLERDALIRLSGPLEDPHTRVRLA
jgi:A/G-specific adenine glycosylase